MTRATNFARKRTYLGAGFHEDPTDGPANQVAAAENTTNPEEIATNQISASVPPPPKKKRRKPGKLSTSSSTCSTGTPRAGKDEKVPLSSPDRLNAVADTQSRKNKRRHKDHAITTELRRKKRISQRQAKTICFACRQNGHAAAECPIIQNKSNVGSLQKIVGICYRCGSTRHALSRCKRAVDPANPLPFANCFICSGKGHLASLCPQNKTRGIYPDGGSCKLCGDNTHLARNCKLRKDESNQQIPFGIGEDGQRGADEDDFHLFTRRKAGVEMDEKNEDKIRRRGDIKIGTHSGIMKAFGKPDFRPTTKKVVHF